MIILEASKINSKQLNQCILLLLKSYYQIILLAFILITFKQEINASDLNVDKINTRIYLCFWFTFSHRENIYCLMFAIKTHIKCVWLLTWMKLWFTVHLRWSIDHFGIQFWYSISLRILSLNISECHWIFKFAICWDKKSVH